MAIAEGSVLNPLSAVAAGTRVTWFLADTDPQAARKRWIAAMKPRGEVIIDDGAAAALTRGKSLLPAGVTEVTGGFGRGEPVTIRDLRGDRLGCGLMRYSSAEARVIAGHRSDEITAILGYPGRAALIHRDDMVL